MKNVFLFAAFAAVLSPAISSRAEQYHVASISELSEAIELAASGDEIVIAAGDYIVSDCVKAADSKNSAFDVTKGITIRSQSGELNDAADNSGKVTIRRTYGTSTPRFRIFELGHGEAILRGLTTFGGCFEDNTGFGGNIHISANGGRVENCVVSDGLSSVSMNSRGGNIYMVGADSVVSNCIIRNGRDTSGAQSYGGGGVYMKDGLLTHCILTNNLSYKPTSNYGGSAAYMEKGKISNCLVAKNYDINGSGVGGAIALAAGIVENCTIVENRSAEKCSGVYLKGGEVWNTILLGNSSGEVFGTADGVFSGSAKAFHNCLSDAEIVGGDSCIAVANFSAAKLTSGYVPRASSPTRNAGENSAARANCDLAGKPRILHSKVDIGCFESAALPPTTALIR